MGADARSDDDPLLRHRLKRLERRHKLSQAHRSAREHEEVRQVVISPYLLMRDAPGEDHAFTNSELSSQGAQVSLFRSSPNEQDGDLRPLPLQIGDGAEQQVEAF